jgi:bacterioferritin
LEVDNSAEQRSLFKSLNEALTAELICALRRRQRQRLALQSARSAATGTELQVWTDFELANRLAERITQLGGHPELAPENLGATDHGESVSHVPMMERVAADLAAERAAAVLYRKLLMRLRLIDPGTSILLCELLVEGEEQVRMLSELRQVHQRAVADGGVPTPLELSVSQ